MNKEVEEAKERLRKGIEDIWFSTLYSQEEEEKDVVTILNYIQKLEEDNKRLKDKCLDMATGKEYAENETIKELQELIHHERISAEAQTTYEVNKTWKEKIEEKIEELKYNRNIYYEGREYEISARIDYAKRVLQQLIKENCEVEG